jgi:hypothetical protein
MEESRRVASAVILVDPRTLRLPPTRLQGADPLKLQRQIAKHGKTTVGMLPLWVTRDKNGELMIVDGVTRATRIAKLSPGQMVPVEITQDEPTKDYSRLPKVGDRLP